MKVKISQVCLFAVVGLGVALTASRARELDGVVLVIADGTSQELITATRVYSLGVRGKLALEDFPNTAVVRTFSANDVVTDSAAAATAMGRGIKTVNGFVGFSPQSPKPAPESILDIARAEGWSTGVVSDDAVVGATPVSFLVEHPKRGEYAAIAAKLIPQMGWRADIVLGGGDQWFFDGGEGVASEYREGELEIVRRNTEALAAAPVEVFRKWEDLRAGIRGDQPVLGLFASNTLPYYADGTRELRLVDMTRAALDFLKAKGRPYCLVVEAALPDKASHANNAKRAMVEVLELDATLAYLRKAVGENALILVTTDHGTGGIALNGYLKNTVKGDILLRTNPGTGSSALTFASGPGGNPDANRRGDTMLDAADPDFSQPALVAKDSAYHTGGDVWLLGSGPGSEVVRGYLDNTDIFRILLAAIRGEAVEKEN